MAAFAACRYAGKVGTAFGSGSGLCKFKAFSSDRKSSTTSAIQLVASLSSPARYCGRSDYRQFSQFVKSNGGRLFLLDTLALVIMLSFSESLPFF